MTSNEALKPCPFCGDDEELRVCQPPHMHGYWVVHCGACGGEMQAETERGAIAGWNTRSTDTPVCASTEEVEAVCAALFANLRIEPVPNTMYDWRIEPESVEEAARATIDAMPASQAPETIERLREALRELAIAAGSLNVATDGADGIRAERLAVLNAMEAAETALSSIPEPLIMPLEGTK